MPQLDFSYYLNQSFWCLLSFFIVYNITSNLISKSLSKIFKKRNDRINANLNFAKDIITKVEKMKSEIEISKKKLNEQYNISLNNAKNDLKKIEEDNYKILEKHTNEKKANLIKDLELIISESELSIKQDIEEFVSKIADLLIIEKKNKDLVNYIAFNIKSREYNFNDVLNNKIYVNRA
jgi:F0F1-type ATP synthase membrane subunit b/b'